MGVSAVSAGVMVTHRKKKREQKHSVHRCSCCGKTGHRLESCPLPGAAKLLSMQRSLKLLKKEKPRPRFRASVGLKSGTSTREHRQEAAASYGSADTSWSRPEHSRLLQQASVFDASGVTPYQAYEDNTFNNEPREVVLYKP